MSLRSEIEADVLTIITELGDGNTAQSTFTWKGVDYTAGATTELFGVTVTVAGNPIDATLALLISPTNFTNGTPVAGNKIAWNGKTYTVGRVRDLHGGGSWLLCAAFN